MMDNSMNVLIAEDDFTSRAMLNAMVRKWGYSPIAVDNGTRALEVMQRPDAPKLVLLDWNMPELDGLEVTRQARLPDTPDPPYIIILTAREDKRDMVHGLEAGANDYVIKPYDQDELRARLEVGRRMVTLQAALRARMRELQEALNLVRTLQGILPICCYCKKIRDDGQYWQQVEEYIATHTDAQFSHAICPDCYEKHCRPMLEELEMQVEASGQ